MSRSTTFKEELELDEIREREEELRRREWEYAESQRRIAEERSERERTIPPMEVIQERIDRKRHEDARGHERPREEKEKAQPALHSGVEDKAVSTRRPRPVSRRIPARQSSNPVEPEGLETR